MNICQRVYLSLKKWILIDNFFNKNKSKCISRKSGLMPCLKTILNCFALEHSAFKTKHFLQIILLKITWTRYVLLLIFYKINEVFGSSNLEGEFIKVLPSLCPAKGELFASNDSRHVRNSRPKFSVGHNGMALIWI